MKKNIIGLVVIIGLLLVGCGSQPNKKGIGNWDPSRDITPTQNGKKHGLVKNFDGYGKILRTTNYSNGVMNGDDTWYSRKTRKVFRVSPYVNGKKNGLERKYSYGSSKEPNTITSYTETDYVNGKIHGIDKEYFSDGRFYYYTPYKNGEIDGLDKLWSGNGTIKKTTSYKNGKKEGTQKIYTYYGSLQETIIWSNNTIKKRYYSKSVKRGIAENERLAKITEKKEKQERKARAKTSSSTTQSSNKGRTRITSNDEKFISGVCSDGTSFFIEVNKYRYEGSGTNGVCSKTDLQGTISCVCNGVGKAR